MINSSKNGFTLAETLITLGIIGVVAAMTIPTLMSAYREKAVVNQLKRVHSILNQAFKLAVAENDEIEGWDIGPQEDNPQSSQKLYLILKPHIKLSEDCGTKGCFSKNTYKALNGKTAFAWQPTTHSMYAKARLLDGTSLAFWSRGKCNDKGNCGVIFVDINGDTLPNQAGLDYFRFNITTKGIIPSTHATTDNKYGREICEYNNNSNLNGANCTKWVLEKGNLDYLRRDVSVQMSKL